MIHILKYGFSLCGMPGFPGDWPEGHKWVSFFDSSILFATYPRCLESHREQADVPDSRVRQDGSRL